VARQYPGNVRELRGLVREMARRAAFEQDSMLTTAHLPESPEETAAPSSANAAAPTPTPLSTPATTPPNTMGLDEAGGVFDEMELPKLVSLRRHRFKISAAEKELGLSTRSRTLTNQLRALCFKALSHKDWNVPAAARLVVGREHTTLEFKLTERMESYLRMVDTHVDAHTTDTLFNNIPRVYRRYLEDAITRSRNGQRLPPPTRPVSDVLEEDG